MAKQHVVRVKFSAEKFPEIVRALKASQNVLDIINRKGSVEYGSEESNELYFALLALKNKAEETRNEKST